jgi:cyclohexadieny/prephenate dehydrogenase
MLGRLTEDLTALQRAIRDGDGKTMETLFARTREIRRGVIDAGQHVPPAAPSDT